MANETIAFDVELKTAKAATGVQSLRTELKNLRNQLATLDEGSAEFSKIAKRAGAVQDKIGDLKDTIAAFHPERKFQAFTQGIQGVVGGFTAVQGAMALFGNESEDLQKTLVKVQGAMALSQGLNSLMGMGDAFKNLKLVAVGAFNSIKAAIGGTGIGLIVIALGTLYANWDKISKAVKDSFPIFNDMTKIFDKLTEVVYGVGEVIKNAILLPFKTFGKLIQGDFSGALEEIKNGYNIIGNYQKGAEKGRTANAERAAEEKLENLIKQKENELEVEKAAGKDTYKHELALNKLKQQAAKDNQDELDKLKQAEKVLVSTHNKELKEKEKKKKDDAKKSDAEFYKEALISLKGFEDEKKARKKQEIEVEIERRAQVKQDNLDDIADAKITAAAKVAINQQAADALAGIGNLAKMLAGESKELMAAGLIAESAAGIAKIIINTNAGAAVEVGTKGIFGLSTSAVLYTNMAISIASVIASTTQALNALGKGGGASGGGNTSAPPPMTRPQSSRVSFDSNGKPISVSDKSRQRVYVVERDITNAQNRVALIQARSKIG